MIALSRHELVIASMYANGFDVRQITNILRFPTEEAARSTVAKVREKYRNDGVDPGTKLRLLDLLDAEPRTWALSTYNATRKVAA